MAANDIYRVTLGWNIGGDNFTNVLHFEQLNATGSGDPELELIHAIGAIITSTLLPILSKYCSLQYGKVKCISPTPRQEVTVVSASVGGVNDQTPPPAHNLTSTQYSALNSKRGRGRTRWAGFPHSAFTNSNATTTVVTTLESFLATLSTTFTQAGHLIQYAQRVWSAADSVGRAVAYLRVAANPRTLKSRRK